MSVSGLGSGPVPLEGADRFTQRALEAAAHVTGALLAYPVLRRAGRRSCLAAALVTSGALVTGAVAAERFINGEENSWSLWFDHIGVKYNPKGSFVDEHQC